MLKRRGRRRTGLSPRDVNVLLALGDTARHGYAIMLEVRRRTDDVVRIGPGTLYTTIKRLRAAGLIEETAGEQVVRRRPRRYYRLSELGREVAREEARRIAALARWAEETGLLP